MKPCQTALDDAEINSNQISDVILVPAFFRPTRHSAPLGYGPNPKLFTVENSDPGFGHSEHEHWAQPGTDGSELGIPG